MGNKEKGSKYERELFQMFVDNNYRAVRVAGSGTMENADCDLIAGKKGRKYAIEVKSSKKPVKYITKEQIESFMVFSSIFGLTPIIAVRFNREGWFFLNPRHMNDSGKNWVVNLELAQKKGRKFSQMFSEKVKQNGNLNQDSEFENVEALLKEYDEDIKIENDLDISKD